MHVNGPIEFTERGSATEALVKVLDRYTNEFPEGTPLEILLLKICGRLGDMEIWGVLTPAAYDRVDWELGRHNWVYGHVSADAEQSGVAMGKMSTAGCI